VQRRNKSHKCKKTQNVVANYHSTCQRRNNVSASHSREAYVAFYRIFCLQFLPRLDCSIGIHILRSHPPECLTETDTQSTECTTCVAIDRIYAMWPNNLVVFLRVLPVQWPMPISHRPPDTTKQCCLCRVGRCELSLETVWQSLNN